ncbi:MAG: hypothetical protein AAGI03_04200 [Pseudomonadota bacterium]
MTDHVLETRNEAWGFYGTIDHQTGDVEAAWAAAFRAIQEATTGRSEAVRDFLDSKAGRWFADEVAQHLQQGVALEGAIAAAIERYMTWTISARTSRETGIPEGLPYLTGEVLALQVAADA